MIEKPSEPTERTYLVGSLFDSLSLPTEDERGRIEFHISSLNQSVFVIRKNDYQNYAVTLMIHKESFMSSTIPNIYSLRFDGNYLVMVRNNTIIMSHYFNDSNIEYYKNHTKVYDYRNGNCRGEV